ncbi:hypothetical protein A4X06_0g3181 [Tilletia controversa]|uniref:Uncharacterized protein n=2 Tax=Tilletia TaxID=13289 RepID=A0A8X7SY19_9BASI|nr:hypothetical protein CF328_g5556 [Tilletia controversa]KAE8201418.1 hypothetical protein CF336_g213 [Tilletia laevis]KAE8207913.1 hypothetical protein CF335_g795 [Tilletia laevis]KAE8249550.1 hypothetical protein A4X06_0g3181 [Tilletia controversa]KAE8262487.1 hypothetical protein A4X03_0g2415 [Tilletia caries]
MANIRLFLLLPHLFLLLATLGQAAPLPDSNHPSGPSLPELSKFEARAGIPGFGAELSPGFIDEMIAHVRAEEQRLAEKLARLQATGPKMSRFAQEEMRKVEKEHQVVVDNLARFQQNRQDGALF